MDRCADQLLKHLPRATDVCPEYRRFAGRVPCVRGFRFARNADRLINRFAVYGNLCASALSRDV